MAGLGTNPECPINPANLIEEPEEGEDIVDEGDRDWSAVLEGRGRRPRPSDPMPEEIKEEEGEEKVQPAQVQQPVQQVGQFGNLPQALPTDDDDIVPPEDHADVSEWVKHIATKERLLDVDTLVWDFEQEHGQIRQLDCKKVAYYEQSIRAQGSPVRHIDVYCKDQGGMQFLSRIPGNNFWTPPFPLTDGHFVLLGGQHVSAALKNIKDDMRKSGLAIPPTIGQVKALVLHQGTSKRLCLLAAGHHQTLQTNTTPVEVVDICNAIIEAARQKERTSGVAMLTDEQLYSILVSCGLHKGDETLLNKEVGAVSAESAFKSQQSTVCYLLLKVAVIPSPFLCRSRVS